MTGQSINQEIDILELQASFRKAKDLLNKQLKIYWESVHSQQLNCPALLTEYEELVKHAMHGSIQWDRALVIATFLHMCKPKTVLEIGSFLGLSSFFILEVTRLWNATLTSVDPNVRHRVFDRPRIIYNELVEPYNNRVITIDAFWLRSVSIESGWWDYRNRKPVLPEEEIRALIANVPTYVPESFQKNGKSFDFGFIDGAHDYASVLHDFVGMSKVMNNRGCIVFDDFDEYAWPETYWAVKDIERDAIAKGAGFVLSNNGIAAFFDQGYFDHIRNSPNEFSLLDNIEQALTIWRKNHRKWFVRKILNKLSSALGVKN